MNELMRALQSFLMSLIGLFSFIYIGFIASLLCFIVAGGYAYLAIKGASK